MLLGDVQIEGVKTEESSNIFLILKKYKERHANLHDVYWFTATSIKYFATTYMKVQPKMKVPNCRPGLRNNSVLPLESQPSKPPTRVSHHLNSQNTPILFLSLHFFPLYTHRTLFFPYRIW